MWTLRKGPPFNCHLGDNCSGGLFGKEMDNDGNNRFVCFRSVRCSIIQGDHGGQGLGFVSFALVVPLLAQFCLG